MSACVWVQYGAGHATCQHCWMEDSATAHSLLACHNMQQCNRRPLHPALLEQVVLNSSQAQQAAQLLQL
jgi:hypothetical protein